MTPQYLNLNKMKIHNSKEKWSSDWVTLVVMKKQLQNTITNKNQVSSLSAVIVVSAGTL